MRPFYNSKNNYQKIVSQTKKMKHFLGVLILLVSLNSFSQTATAPSGTGALCDPYLISSLDNLYWVSQNSSSWASGKYFVQTANIDATSTSSWNSGAGWSPIGNLSTRFYANYDGRGYTISNLYINRTGSGIGFFGFTQSGTIKNMYFSNVSLTAAITDVYGVGILSAYSYLSTFTNCKITNSTFNTSGSQCYAGTMFGRMSNVTVSYCNSTANAAHTNASAVHAPYGGLIGSLESGGGTITYSYATGNVSKSTGGNRTGGFIGIVEAGTVSKCYASGNVTTANQGGGFVGNSYTCTFSDCYAVGNVNSTASDGKGSFAGFAQSGTTFTRCYGAGVLSGYVGGWSGGWSGYTTDATFNNCFFDQTTTGYANAFGYASNNTGSPTATTTANMKTQTTFSSAGWDFTSTWAIAGGVNNGYPTLIIPTVTISTAIPGCPSITATGTTSAFSTCLGTPSSAQTITVSGSDLTANISLSAPSGFEISTSAGSGYASSLTLTQSAGTVSATTIYIRLSGSVSGSLSGNISMTSTGASTQTSAVSGSVCIPPTSTAPVGSGTQCDPYLISSIENLYWLTQTTSAWASGNYFVQTENIDASSTSTWNSGQGWSPVGNLSTRFYANYDGRGYTISNLYINRSGSGIGFFGFTQSGTIQNMYLSNVSLTAVITDVYGVGILSAYSYLSTFTNCKITNSTFNTSGSQCYAGTMFGRMSNVTVSYCNSTANAAHTNASAVHAPYGGLIGSLESGGGTITYSYATGNVSKSTGGNRTGGFIGIVEAGTVSKCYASGNVTTANQGGGFVGNSYTCTFSDCYAVGNVNSTASDGKGSFAGFAQSGTTFTRCYGAGVLSGYVGGWSGGWSGYTTDATFNNCFFDQTTTGYANAFGYASNNTGSPTATTTANMKTQTTFSSAGWDFTSTWAIAGGVNNGYPTLRIPTVTIAPLFAGCPSWIGTTSTDWATASNWSNNAVPASGSNIIINAAAVNNLVLDQNRTIGIVTFNNASRNIVLGNYDLTAGGSDNTNTTNYIQSTGTGKLKLTIGNAESATFPIGNASYNPVTITNNSGASDVFSAQVVDAVYVNGTSGTEVSTAVVDRTWNISKTNANGGSGIGFVFNWNTGEVINGTFTNPRMNHHTGSNWEVPSVASTVYGANSLTVTGYTGTFSPFAISEGLSALPVEMVYFRANCEGSATDIQWETATEHNSSHFILEKSVDGINWFEIAKYIAAGNSTTVIDYEFVDDSKLSRELVYYRLLQFDLDGKSAIYGPISSACQDVNEFEMVVAPNPNNGQFTLQIASMEKQEVKMELYNSNGLLVEIKSLSINEGVSMEYMDFSQLKPGIYNLQIQHSNGISNRKISIQ